MTEPDAGTGAETNGVVEKLKGYGISGTMLYMNFNANLTVSISKQGRRFVAYSPALDISTSGRTEVQAKKRFMELVNLFVEELEEAGTTAVVLTELGWKKAGTRSRAWMPPTFKTAKMPVRIPVAA